MRTVEQAPAYQERMLEEGMRVIRSQTGKLD
jgi:hypothetical protein